MRLFFFLFLFLLIACKPIQERENIQNAEFAPKSLTLTKVVGITAYFNLKMEVYNPTNSRMVLDRLDYDLIVNNRPVGNGKTPMQLTIPSQSSSILQTEVSAQLFDIGETGILALQKQGVEYYLKGTAHVDSKLGTYSYPFTTETGRILLPDVPSLKE